MHSSALPSEAHIKGLEYHALRTLARIHGLTATGKREEIRERLLQWRAEFGLKDSVDAHVQGSDSSSGSGGSKENVGGMPQEPTARKRKAEELATDKDVPEERQRKRILVDSVVINTDVLPSPSPSQPAQPLPTLLSSLPETPLPSSPILSPPFPLQCPGIPQHPLQTWDTMFFIQDPDGCLGIREHGTTNPLSLERRLKRQRSHDVNVKPLGEGEGGVDDQNAYGRRHAD
ncbi:hypothetical protein DFH11DRAFT_1726103 [Phellopilus nigrolimitatus]|nr:hypothetical protein DFH11DRAFT_1726103 [Phellopilus nigrolimitatus]